MIILRVIAVTVITALCVWRLRCTILSTPRRECRLPSHTSNCILASRQEALAGICDSESGQVLSRSARSPPTAMVPLKIMSSRVAQTSTNHRPFGPGPEARAENKQELVVTPANLPSQYNAGGHQNDS